MVIEEDKDRNLREKVNESEQPTVIEEAIIEENEVDLNVEKKRESAKSIENIGVADPDYKNEKESESNLVDKATCECEDKEKEEEAEAEEIKEKIKDIPLINKSDKIVISAFNQLNPLKHNETSEYVQLNDENKKSPTDEKFIQVIELKTNKVAIKEEEEEKLITNGEHAATIEIDSQEQATVNENEELDKQQTNDKNEKEKEIDKKAKAKLSFWSKVWTSTTNNTDNEKNEKNVVTVKSNDTSIEIIDSPEGSKKNGSVETAETVEIAVINNGQAEEVNKFSDENMIPTHLFFRVKSPYLKYLFSFAILVIILLICALLVIFFPNIFDLNRFTNQMINLYSNNATSAKIVPMVTTNCGHYKGILGDDNVASFQGISYAKSPKGKRRWLPAEENICNKSNIFESYTSKEFCYQKPINKLNITFSEDCLYLNIWTPNWQKNEVQMNPNENRNGSKSDQLPVFIYLTGDMITGYNSMDIQWLPKGNEIAKQYNCIFITLNYRFGVLGFYSLDILHKRSKNILNYGLSDIIMSLKWINENIEYFGGDPEQTTLLAYGSSATLALVAATNEYSSQYLTKLWLATPAPTYANVSLRETFEMNNQFINNVGCQPNLTVNMRITDLEEQVINCLLNVSPEVIVNSTPLYWYENFNILPSNKMELTTIPILIFDNYFLKANPYQLLDSTNVEIIFGLNSELTGALSEKPTELENWNDQNFAKYIQTQLASINPLVNEEVINQYINSSDFLSNEQIYHQLVTEIRFICPLFKSLENVTNLENIYIYLNKYKPSNPISFSTTPSESRMSIHGIDVIALMNIIKNWFIINPTENDLRYMDNMQKELKSYIHSSDTFTFKNLSKNQINLIKDDGTLTVQPLPIHNCHRFWSPFIQYAKVN